MALDYQEGSRRAQGEDSPSESREAALLLAAWEHRSQY